jgi:histidine triad (HIT) family protein
MSCIFCDIYNNKKELILYESNKSVVLLDRFPMSKGHLLVIPKVHHSFLHEYQNSDLSDIFDTIIHAVKYFKFTKYNILQNNINYQSVLHVHFHVIPCNDDIERLKIDWTRVDMNEEEYLKLIKDSEF